MNPLVSICMPHLNSRPFTEERMASILEQTLGDWELIIVDSQSDDGSREVLEGYAAGDPRIRISDGPRDGIYTNLNRAIELARGEYVYIATSDDTMTPDCLARMADALERNPDCGVCHCCLEIIDEKGDPVREDRAWENWAQPNFFGELVKREHVRQAPHDGLLHFGLYTLYTSLTQLLVRRRVYEELGMFRTDCRSNADFEWGMRVALNENVVHVPETLATWRQHDLQATQSGALRRARARGDFRRMAHRAIESVEARDPAFARALRKSDLNHYYLVAELSARRTSGGSVLSRFAGMGGYVLKHPIFSLKWFFRKAVLRRRMTGEFGDAVRAEFTRLGLKDLIRTVEPEKCSVRG